MGAAFTGVDVVDIAEHFLVILVVVLQGDFNLDGILLAFDGNRRIDQHPLELVQIADKLADTALGLKALAADLITPAVGDGDGNSLIQEGELPEPAHQHFIIERILLHDAVIRSEADHGPRPV
ncbi:hypothetical protein DSECCO2_529560 [anaerobic digester metagenome]